MKQNLTNNWINHEVIEAFKWGDRCGLPFEGHLLFPTVINEDRLQLAMKSSQGSDESSIVDCFTAFANCYQYTDREQFVLDWCLYHQRHHGTGYGRTYRDHFELVKYIGKSPLQYLNQQSVLAKLQEIATDANSFGNGSLAIVYPAYCYAQAIGEQPVEFVRYLVSFTHAHEDAQKAVTLLCSFIEDPERIADYAVGDDEEFRRLYCQQHATAYNTLMTAVKCAMKATDVEVIREAVRIGGDTDSTLATALLLWKLRNMSNTTMDTKCPVSTDTL